MSEAETQSADADNDEAESDEFTYYPQVTQHPTTIIEGDIVDIVTGADIDSGVEQTGASFGVVFEDPTVEAGTTWRNRDIPEGFTSNSEYNDALRLAIEGDDNDYVRGQEVTDERIEAAKERLDDAGVDYEGEEFDEVKVSGTDYKVADPDDSAAEVQEVDGTTLGIDVGGGVFSSEQVEGFFGAEEGADEGDSSDSPEDADRIMVWYGGMSGQFVGRGLDFNGMPFARYTDDNYLLKGLFQVPIGWRGDADVEQYDNVPTTDRSELATDLGRKPRVVRPPILRDDIDGRGFIAIGRYNGGQMHEVHIGRAQDDYSEVLDAMAENSADVDDHYDALEMRYDQSPEDRIAAEFENPSEVIALYHGEGWQDEPEGADAFSSSGDDSGDGSFDIETDLDADDVDHPTEAEVAFGEQVAEKIAGTGADPDDDIFGGEDGKTDLEGLVGKNAGRFDVTPDVDAVRRVVYENTDHLDANSLDD